MTAGRQSGGDRLYTPPVLARFLTVTILTLGFLGSVPRVSHARKTASWRIAGAPGWVLPSPGTVAVDPPADTGVWEYLLDDTQTRATPKTLEQYRHVKYRPRSPSQVEDGSQVQINWAPSQQRLVIHHAHVVRDGRVVSAIAARDVKVVQRERDLEQRIYDGSLTALVFLRDVRVGDVVDYAFSLVGGDPFLQGKMAIGFALADSSFMAAWRQRIVVPADRTLTIKSHGLDIQPTITDGKGAREYLWQRHAVAPIRSEDRLPVWYDAQPWVQVSEFRSWSEVAGMFERLYRDPHRASPALAAVIDRLRAWPGTAEDRLLEATRFVQDEVRYLGLEVGLGGHKPSNPSTVVARRFGDCKDKTVLLVALLSSLGFDARPALVSSTRRRGLDDDLPSPHAFDHVIVRVTVNGTAHFIDPTMSYQRGRLAVRQPPPFERALALGDSAHGLTTIPVPRLTAPSTVQRETFTLAERGPGADLQVETIYRGGDADRTRARLAGRQEGLARGYLNYYARENPTVTSTASLETVDDPQDNVMTVRERYHFSDFWKDTRHDFTASALTEALDDPGIRLRTMPFALEHPLWVAHVTTVRAPIVLDVVGDSKEIDDGFLRFRFRARVAGNGKDLILNYELETLADVVPPEKAPRQFAARDEVRNNLGYWLRRPGSWVASHDHSMASPMGWLGLGWLAAICLSLVGLGIGGLLRWNRRRDFRARGQFASGEAAATAIPLRSETEVPSRVASLRCSCGARCQPASIDQVQRVTYADRTLLVQSTLCPTCRKQAAVFFALPEG